MTTLTATITVAEDQRVVLDRCALRAGMDMPTLLNAALAAGLADCAEQSEASSPDGVFDAFRDLHPPSGLMPELAAEFDALHHGVLVPLINKTQGMPDEAAEGETVRMTIMLPREWAILAAWLEIKGRMRRNGDLSPIGNAITLDTRLAHWHKAKAYVLRELHNHFHEELHVLATHHHPYLYRPKPEAAKPPRADCESLDDGLPF